MTRRTFLAAVAAQAATTRDPIIDIHGHPPILGYHSEKWVLAHPRHHHITTTMLLPVNSAAGKEKIGALASLFPKVALGQDSAQRIAMQHPGDFRFFANADTRRKDAHQLLEKYLKAGAVGIGEVKLPLACDAPEMDRIYDVARAFKVPVLIHFQHKLFATGIERFHKVVERYPQVNFIGHAQTWWSNIGRTQTQNDLYPTGPVQSGGFTDILLTNYPNVYADLSAASGFGAISRDTKHWRAFATRHQNKLLFGSDCVHDGMEGGTCWAARTLHLLRTLGPTPEIVRKLLAGNAQRLFTAR